MGRNLNHRVEMMFPVESKRLITRLREILETYLNDNRNARAMRPDGSWVWEKMGAPTVDSQAHFLIPSRLP
jgi:polyphosphate kinase